MSFVKIFNGRQAAIDILENKEPKLLKIGDRKFCLVRIHDKLYATANRCPHNGESLNKGHINHLGEVICPWHNYRFSLLDGKESENRTPDLRTYPIEIKPDGVFIKLES